MQDDRDARRGSEGIRRNKSDRLLAGKRNVVVKVKAGMKEMHQGNEDWMAEDRILTLQGTEEEEKGRRKGGDR